ncbi:MAG: ATP-dependent zinc metalloprotease FtsH [Candidatus Neomarinimicrobiota bacterium]
MAKKKNNNKKIKFKLGNNLMVWVMIVMASFYLVQLVPNSLSTNEVNYNQYRNYLVNGEIYHIQYGQDDKIVFWLQGDEVGLNKFWTGLDKSEKEDWVKYSVSNIEIKPKAGLGLMDIIFNLAPWVIIILFWFFMMRRMQGGSGGQGGIFNFVKSKAKMVSPENSKTSFNDVAGCEEAKVELQEIVQFLKKPKKYLSLGAKIPRGALLLGSPGTGKTLLARAVSGEAQVPFFTISGAEFVEMFVGVGASRVRDLFSQAKKFAPSIIFVDEIDAVGRHRGSGMGGGHDEREQTLNQILVEMDGFDERDHVILLAATNRPDVLDKALLRPGRFDRQIVVDAPTMEGREAILKIHTKKIPLEKDVKLIDIAKGCPGLVGADLENLVNEAALLAARKNRKTVSMLEFEEAKDKVMMGVERKSMILTDQEKKITAFHEAGHALIAHYTNNADPVHKVTIIPRGMALGITAQLPEHDIHNYSKSYLLAKIDVLMGGRSAEKLIFNDTSSGAGNDIEVATNIARKMVCEWGMSEKIGPIKFGKNEDEMFMGRESSSSKNYGNEISGTIDQEIKDFVFNAEKNADNLLKKREIELHNLAEALLKYETIDSTQLPLALKGESLVVESSNNEKEDLPKKRKRRTSSAQN